jgi:hypothetical protein
MTRKKVSVRIVSRDDDERGEEGSETDVRMVGWGFESDNERRAAIFAVLAMGVAIHAKKSLPAESSLENFVEAFSDEVLRIACRMSRAR